MLQCYVILMPFVGGVATILKRVARNLRYCNDFFCSSINDFQCDRFVL
jgi:hypothetical protein